MVLILKFLYFYWHVNDDLLLRHSINIDNINQCMDNDNSPIPLTGLGEETNNNGNSRSSNISNVEDKSSPKGASPYPLEGTPPNPREVASKHLE